MFLRRSAGSGGLPHETQREKDDNAYIQRVKGNPLAVKVKLNELRDNMDTTRMPEVREKDVARLNKYLKA